MSSADDIFFDTARVLNVTGELVLPTEKLANFSLPGWLTRNGVTA